MFIRGERYGLLSGWNLLLVFRPDAIDLCRTSVIAYLGARIDC